jgi:hypothetical protein
LFLYPTPNSLNEPSLLYKKDGCNIIHIVKTNKNIIIDTNNVLFLANILDIYIIITFF